MADSNFDPETFMSTGLTGANSTKTIPIKECECLANINELRLRTPKDSTILEVDWEPQDEDLKRPTNREHPVARQSIFLDMVHEAGKPPKLDMREGMNTGLGKLREAVGLNDPTRQFNINMLKGMAAFVQITHRTDPTSGDKYAEVRRVAKPGSGFKAGAAGAASGAAAAARAAAGGKRA